MGIKSVWRIRCESAALIVVGSVACNVACNKVGYRAVTSRQCQNNESLANWDVFIQLLMAIIDVVCPHCFSSAQVVRNGYTRGRHQRYLCRRCDKTFQLSFVQKASVPGSHQQIIDMAMNGVGCRATARIMGISLNTVLRHLKNSIPSNIKSSLEGCISTDRDES
ncbi:transposase [Serratia sp. DD3]|nr:transposase [Serratia sp. DD3]